VFQVEQEEHAIAVLRLFGWNHNLTLLLLPSSPGLLRSAYLLLCDSTVMFRHISVPSKPAVSARSEPIYSIGRTDDSGLLETIV
jgi:hypothetical protein